MRPVLSHYTYFYLVRSKFPGIRCYNLQESLLWIKKRTLTYFVALGMRSEGNAPKKWRTSSSVLLYDNGPAHWSVLVKDFLAKNNVTTLLHPPHSPDPAPADFYCSLHWNQHWRDGAFVMLLTLRMRRKSWKGFHKMAPSRNISNTFTVAGRTVQLHKERYVKWLYYCVFLRNKVIPGTFWIYLVVVHTHFNVNLQSGSSFILPFFNFTYFFCSSAVFSNEYFLADCCVRAHVCVWRSS